MNNAAQTVDLKNLLAADPGALVEKIARDHSVPLREVVEALPSTMRRFAPGEAFVAVMTEVANWGEVTVVLHSDDGVMEFTGPVPAGKIGHGYFNIEGRTGFHGHLRHDRCAGVAFVERPLFGRPSAAILFFNPEGGIMFKIFVGRDEKRELRSDQLTAFRALADRLDGA